MERTFSQDDRIRRAEEIYARRQSLRERTKKARVNVQSSEPKNLKFFKKLSLQIIICILIYYIFYLINTTNYSFSEDALSKTKDVLAYDFDFYSVYNIIVENINAFLVSEDEKEVDNNQNEGQGNLEMPQEHTEGLEGMQVEEESVNQMEVSFAYANETERIKQTYNFVLPVSGRISSEFGEREVTSSVITAYHKGIDIAANSGTSIVSSIDGEVIISKYSQSYGNYAIVQNNEVKTVYAHCSSLLVNVGDKVTAGQEIAKVGATRRCNR